MGLSGKLSARNFYLLIISFFGTGFISKKIPGTIGSAFATIITLFVFQSSYALLYLSVATFIAGVIFCDIFIVRKKFDTNKDPSYAVIDEAAGIFFAAYLLGLFLELSALSILINFILFRLFDILKPSPIRNIERFMKKNNNTIGLGMMLDDIVAAIFATALQIAISNFL